MEKDRVDWKMIGGLGRNLTSSGNFPGLFPGKPDGWLFSREENYTGNGGLDFVGKENSEITKRDPLYIVIPITVVYGIIFLSGLIGNVSTCVVVAKNKSMHTATNYYLFSLAISDLVLLVSGLPSELYFIWSHFPYVFGEAFCVITSFAAETSANATVLTITAFTVERYVAICHPFVSHTMSKLSRAVKYIVAIWLLALCLAIPQAIQYGLTYQHGNNGTIDPETSRCSIKWKLTKHVFEISTMLFFVLPMTVITVLYILIAIKLRRSRVLQATVKSRRITGPFVQCDSNRGRSVAQRNVIRMLVAVVVAFFICWAPFHAQRLLAIYVYDNDSPHPTLKTIYVTLTYVSGVLYYLSATVNPLLYNIMSNKFREAFKSMLSKQCRRKWSSENLSPRRATYSSLSRYPRSNGRRQASGSLSVSEESQRTSNHVTRQQDNTNGNELNDLSCWSKGNKSKTGSCENTARNPSDFLRGGSSNSTLMTSISKDLNEGNNNLTQTSLSDNIFDSRARQKTITLGLLADRLRFGTKGLFRGEKRSTNTCRNATPEVASAVPTRLQSQASIDSANTISNSSLQDLDETEFVGTELAQYMGQLNLHLVT